MFEPWKFTFPWSQPQVVLPQDIEDLRHCLLMVYAYVILDFIKVHCCILPYPSRQDVVDEVLECSGAPVGRNCIFRGANCLAWHTNTSFSLLEFPYWLLRRFNLDEFQHPAGCQPVLWSAEVGMCTSQWLLPIVGHKSMFGEYCLYYLCTERGFKVGHGSTELYGLCLFLVHCLSHSWEHWSQPETTVSLCLLEPARQA